MRSVIRDLILKINLIKQTNSYVNILTHFVLNFMFKMEYIFDTSYMCALSLGDIVMGLWIEQTRLSTAKTFL